MQLFPASPPHSPLVVLRVLHATGDVVLLLLLAIFVGHERTLEKAAPRHRLPILGSCVAIRRNIVHVREQLVPSHLSGRFIGRVSVPRASASIRIRPELFAHLWGHGRGYTEVWSANGRFGEPARQRKRPSQLTAASGSDGKTKKTNRWRRAIPPC